MLIDHLFKPRALGEYGVSRDESEQQNREG
jgi:hypothetical protein